MYPKKQPKPSSSALELEWALELHYEMLAWQTFWFFNAPGVVSSDRKIHD